MSVQTGRRDGTLSSRFDLEVADRLSNAMFCNHGYVRTNPRHWEP